jgi:hypothetical protein
VQKLSILSKMKLPDAFPRDRGDRKAIQLGMMPPRVIELLTFTLLF